MTRRILLAATAFTALGFTASATTYLGNGNTGFGGPVGTGSLTLTDNGTTVSGTFTPGNNGFGGNGLVLYIDSGPGGFTSTAGFNDNADGNRSEISGYSSATQQSILTFQSGFAPNYAIALSPGGSENFGGLWQLANGGANSLPFVANVNMSPTSAGGASYTFNFTLSSIGVTPGNSFELFGTYVSDSGYRSTEAIAGNDSGTQGWNPFTQTGFVTYTTAAVPEPTAAALGTLGGLLGLLVFKRRK